MNAPLKIEKGIPLPSKRNAEGMSRADALRKMKVGDSVAADLTASKRSAWFKVAADVGVKIATRANGGEGRVWRVK